MYSRPALVRIFCPPVGLEKRNPIRLALWSPPSWSFCVIACSATLVRRRYRPVHCLRRTALIERRRSRIVPPPGGQSRDDEACDVCKSHHRSPGEPCARVSADPALPVNTEVYRLPEAPRGTSVPESSRSWWWRRRVLAPALPPPATAANSPRAVCPVVDQELHIPRATAFGANAIASVVALVEAGKRWFFSGDRPVVLELGGDLITGTRLASRLQGL